MDDFDIIIWCSESQHIGGSNKTVLDIHQNTESSMASDMYNSDYWDDHIPQGWTLWCAFWKTIKGYDSWK